ncbi:MAG: hypothetical protein ACK413_01650 [Patescibacteria group bacterium]
MAIFPFEKEEKEIPKVPEEKKEIVTLPEKKPEVEKEKEAKIEGIGEVPIVTPPPSITIPKPTEEEVITPPKIEKSPTLIKIEEILSEDLDELYNSLTAEQKIIFKKKGEETASKIEILIQEVKINIKKILNLIKEWLLMLVKMIPGVNKFFLIQEAKIKTDKILKLREK